MHLGLEHDAFKSMNVLECGFCENAHAELRAVLGGGGWCRSCAGQIGQGKLWDQLSVVKAVSAKHSTESSK